MRIQRFVELGPCSIDLQTRGLIESRAVEELAFTEYPQCQKHSVNRDSGRERITRLVTRPSAMFNAGSSSRPVILGLAF
jgi:hypothetical protein